MAVNNPTLNFSDVCDIFINCYPTVTNGYYSMGNSVLSDYNVFKNPKKNNKIENTKKMQLDATTKYKNTKKMQSDAITKYTNTKNKQLDAEVVLSVYESEETPVTFHVSASESYQDKEEKYENHINKQLDAKYVNNVCDYEVTPVTFHVSPSKSHTVGIPEKHENIKKCS